VSNHQIPTLVDYLKDILLQVPNFLASATGFEVARKGIMSQFSETLRQGLAFFTGD
jgi:hypothetical protein